jgi:hypothetical protein
MTPRLVRRRYSKGLLLLTATAQERKNKQMDRVNTASFWHFESGGEVEMTTHLDTTDANPTNDLSATRPRLSI